MNKKTVTMEQVLESARQSEALTVQVARAAQTALEGKQDVLENGDGTTVVGNKVNLNTPIKGIVTQAEFDALSEEEKNNGLYVVDDGDSGDSGGSAGEVYSTEETRIGTWIDGKPIYRSVLTGTFSNHTDWSEYGDASYVDTLINARYICVDAKGYKKSGPDNISAIGITPNGKWGVYIYNYILGAKFIMIREYTKTTDEGSGTA